MCFQREDTYIYMYLKIVHAMEKTKNNYISTSCAPSEWTHIQIPEIAHKGEIKEKCTNSRVLEHDNKCGFDAKSISRYLE